MALRTGRPPAALVGRVPPTSAFLRGRCDSAALAALGFAPDAAAVDAGIREACAACVEEAAASVN